MKEVLAEVSQSSGGDLNILTYDCEISYAPRPYPKESSWKLSKFALGAWLPNPAAIVIHGDLTNLKERWLDNLFSNCRSIFFRGTSAESSRAILSSCHHLERIEFRGSFLPIELPLNVVDVANLSIEMCSSSEHASLQNSRARTLELTYDLDFPNLRNMLLTAQRIFLRNPDRIGDVSTEIGTVDDDFLFTLEGGNVLQQLFVGSAQVTGEQLLRLLLLASKSFHLSGRKGGGLPSSVGRQQSQISDLDIARLDGLSSSEIESIIALCPNLTTLKLPALMIEAKLLKAISTLEGLKVLFVAGSKFAKSIPEGARVPAVTSLVISERHRKLKLQQIFPNASIVSVP